MKDRVILATIALTLFLLSSCSAAPDESDLVWAVNVGGSSYLVVDGTAYEAESSVAGGDRGTMATVKGSQDAELYRTFRTGDIRVVREIPNGTYDITFHFAESDDVPGGAREFEAFAEGNRVLDDLDVKAFRDGKVFSALTVTTPDVVVNDGELNINFEASAGEPTLSALVVRDKNRPGPEWELVWSDEFDGAELDLARWSPNIWPPRKVNDEDQAYTCLL